MRIHIPRLIRTEHLRYATLGGKEEDPAISQKRTDAHCGIKTIEPRHDHIAEQNVREPSLRHPDGSRAIVHRNGLEAAPIKDLVERSGDHWLIIRNQDLWFRFLGERDWDLRLCPGFAFQADG